MSPKPLPKADPAGFEQLMRRHNRQLFRTARAILRDDAEAEDALQEAYIQAYRALPGFRGESRSLEKGMRFRYTGWLRGQVIVPGPMLLGGVNTFVLQINDEATPVVVRSIEIELKHPSAVFDYDLKP